MDPYPYCGLVQLSRTTRFPADWLKEQALAGKIPCLKVGRRMVFNPDAVRAAIANLAAGSVAPAQPQVVTARA